MALSIQRSPRLPPPMVVVVPPLTPKLYDPTLHSPSVVKKLVLMLIAPTQKEPPKSTVRLIPPLMWMQRTPTVLPLQPHKNSRSLVFSVPISLQKVRLISMAQPPSIKTPKPQPTVVVMPPPMCSQVLISMPQVASRWSSAHSMASQVLPTQATLMDKAPSISMASPPTQAQLTLITPREMPTPELAITASRSRPRSALFSLLRTTSTATVT